MVGGCRARRARETGFEDFWQGRKTWISDVEWEEEAVRTHRAELRVQQFALPRRGATSRSQDFRYAFAKEVRLLVQLPQSRKMKAHKFVSLG